MNSVFLNEINRLFSSVPDFCLSNNVLLLAIHVCGPVKRSGPVCARCFLVMWLNPFKRPFSSHQTCQRVYSSGWVGFKRNMMKGSYVSSMRTTFEMIRFLYGMNKETHQQYHFHKSVISQTVVSSEPLHTTIQPECWGRINRITICFIAK